MSERSKKIAACLLGAAVRDAIRGDDMESNWRHTLDAIITAVEERVEDQYDQRRIRDLTGNEDGTVSWTEAKSQLEQATPKPEAPPLRLREIDSHTDFEFLGRNGEWIRGQFECFDDCRLFMAAARSGRVVVEDEAGAGEGES